MSIYLPMVRLNRSETLGYVPEDVTVKEFRVLQYEYCAWQLADAWLKGKLVYMPMEMPELSDEPIALTAMCIAEYAEQLAEAAAVMCEGRRIQRADFPHDTDIEFGYDIAPAGMTETFGAYSENTRGWLSIHRLAPALLFRDGDEEAEQLVDIWLEHWANMLDVRKAWPDQASHAGLIVPEVFHIMREKLNRKAKSRRMAARFIGAGR